MLWDLKILTVKKICLNFEKIEILITMLCFFLWCGRLTPIMTYIINEKISKAKCDGWPWLFISAYSNQKKKTNKQKHFL